VCHWLLDVKRWRGWETPFMAFGRNPLAAYFLSVAGDALLMRWTVTGEGSLKEFVYQRAVASWAAPRWGPEAASLLYACIYVVIWALVMVVMYRRRVFVGI
jgi:predicted acyltransferase